MRNNKGAVPVIVLYAIAAQVGIVALASTVGGADHVGNAKKVWQRMVNPPTITVDKAVGDESNFAK